MTFISGLLQFDMHMHTQVAGCRHCELAALYICMTALQCALNLVIRGKTPKHTTQSRPLPAQVRTHAAQQ